MIAVYIVIVAFFFLLSLLLVVFIPTYEFCFFFPVFFLIPLGEGN